MSGDTIDVPDAANPVVDALLRASRALVSITARSLASVNDEVTLPQFRTLVVLSSQGSQTVSALADHLAVHASTMTRMCNRLVTRGLVERATSPADRREGVITLTATGSAIVDQVTQNRRRELDAVVRRMSEDERRAVVSALTTFARAAGEDGPMRSGEQLAARSPAL